MTTVRVTPYSLDDYFKSTPIGSVDKAIGDNLYGINHRQTSGIVPSNKDSYGLTFFTRPQLNMQGDNIRNIRLMYPLLNINEESMHRFVRCTLDPRLMYGYEHGRGAQTATRKNTKIPPMTCSLLDNVNAFIPVLTNNLTAISGWPDITAPTFTSNAGLYKEAYSQVDGLTRNYEAFTLDATFRNTRGDPILYLFYIWMNYASLVHEGRLLPYIDYISENEIDYNTRIYRLVLDTHKDFVTKITATGASFPISVPTGSFFDYTNERPFNDQNKDISVRFQCMGVDYLDDILISEFNQTVGIFNPDMRSNASEKDRRYKSMVKIPKILLPLFNNRGYPHINTNTYELEWWVNKDLFENRAGAFLKTNLDPEVSAAIKNAASKGTRPDQSTAKPNTGITKPLAGGPDPAGGSYEPDSSDGRER